MANGFDNSATDASPDARRARIARRVGSASAANAASRRWEGLIGSPSRPEGQASLRRCQQLRKLVVALRRAVLHAGLDDGVANFPRRVEHRGGERCLTFLLNEDRGYLRLTREVVERFHVDGALRRRELAIDAAHAHFPSIRATHHEAKAAA